MAADTFGPKGEPQFNGGTKPRTAENLTLVGAYAAKVGNRMADTSAVRAGLDSGALSDGLEFYETDTGKTYRYSAALPGWVQPLRAGAVQTSGVANPATGFTIVKQQLSVLLPGLGSLYFTFKATGPVTVPSDGNMNNLTTANLINGVATVHQATPLSTGAEGRNAGFILNTDGSIRLVSVAGGQNIATNDLLSCGGVFFL